MPGEGDTEEYRRRLGESAQQLQQSLAWKTMYNNVLRLRESFVQKLIVGDEDAVQTRKAIVVMDAILKMPAALVEDGKRARES